MWRGCFLLPGINPAYNQRVPTPFYHLVVAEDLLKNPGLPDGTTNFLRQYWGAFLLGNVAPDVQVVSGQPREATHFFELPIHPGDQPAWVRCLSAYPVLAQPAGLQPEQAAFLAGYLCHLQADWYWVLEIFAPVFGASNRWANFSHRLYLHNVLRSYLDQTIFPRISDETLQSLRAAAPSGWLSFVQDAHLLAWKDLLIEQLQPGSAVRTVEVFAARQGISPEAYYRLMDSAEEMEREIFSRLPLERLSQYRLDLIEHNRTLVQTYLSDFLHTRHRR